jgi:molybdate transport system substrate-binding protein
MRRALSALATTVAAGAAAASLSCAEDEPRLRVLAAASLTDFVETIVPEFGGVRVETAFGASSALARQIRDGAPADVFLSASPAWIESLREADALAGEPVVLARNRLACIALRNGLLAAAAVADPAALIARLPAEGRVAIADAGVPAGEYARAALESLGLHDSLAPRLVGLGDVRAVLRAVERGEAEAGFVYSTDARVAGVSTLFTFDPATHPPIEYRGVALRNARSPDQARAFLEFLRSDEARRALAAAGFELP